MPGKKYDSVASSFRLKSGNNPLFKLMGSSPVQDNPEATHPEHHEVDLDLAQDFSSLPPAPDIQEVGPAEKTTEEPSTTDADTEDEEEAPVKIYNKAGKRRKNYKY